MRVDTDILMYLTRIAIVGPALIIIGVLFDAASPGDWSKTASADPRSSAIVMASVVFGIAWAVR
ncbi:MAG: hypothetical protein GF364_22815 [Candidatus Lokiarchaeota archaeon]|nr:hypothetical protein [Candidatus Lokiarchaeota archaeon]